MKSLLFVAFALSLIFMVSSQQSCDIGAFTTCAQNYENMIASATSSDELERINREVCQSTCVTSTLPACTSLGPTLERAANQIMQACSQLNDGPPSAGYSVFALLSSIILAGVAAVFF